MFVLKYLRHTIRCSLLTRRQYSLASPHIGLIRFFPAFLVPHQVEVASLPNTPPVNPEALPVSS